MSTHANSSAQLGVAAYWSNAPPSIRLLIMLPTLSGASPQFEYK